MSAARQTELLIMRLAGVAIVIAALIVGAIMALWLIFSNVNSDNAVARTLLTPFVGIVGGTCCISSSTAASKWFDSQARWAFRAVYWLAVVTSLWWLVFLWFCDWYDAAASVQLRVLNCLTTLTVAAAFITGLLNQTPAIAIIHYIHWGISAWLACLATAICALVWISWWYDVEEVLAGVVLFGAFITLMMLVSTISLNRMAARRHVLKPESVPKDITLRLTCPNCQAEQQLSTGLQQCTHCKWKLLIEIEEPRCECGYLVYKLQGDTCPECGRRWTPAPAAT